MSPATRLIGQFAFTRNVPKTPARYGIYWRLNGGSLFSIRSRRNWRYDPIRHSEQRLRDWELVELVREHPASTGLPAYGVWMYYPWSNRLAYLLDRDEFIELRTNRNRYKITPGEQETLAGKRIGIAGLSAGQSIAAVLALQRSCGELRLADFDSLELSNLNRVRAGVHDIGLLKVM